MLKEIYIYCLHLDVKSLCPNILFVKVHTHYFVTFTFSEEKQGLTQRNIDFLKLTQLLSFGRVEADKIAKN